MSADDRWRRVEPLYEAALPQAPADCGAFLESVCGGDETVRVDRVLLLSRVQSTSPVRGVATGSRFVPSGAGG